MTNQQVRSALHWKHPHRYPAHIYLLHNDSGRLEKIRVPLTDAESIKSYMNGINSLQMFFQ